MDVPMKVYCDYKYGGNNFYQYTGFFAKEVHYNYILNLKILFINLFLKLIQILNIYLINKI